MSLIKVDNDIVFEQNVLTNPSVYYTDDYKFKVIVSDFMCSNRFISIAYNPCTSECPSVDLCQTLLIELGFKNAKAINNLVANLNPGVMRFLEF